MKKGILFGLLCCISTAGMAQWTAKIGINAAPLIAKTVEVISEFSYHPAFAIQAGAGGTFGTKHIGLIDYKVDDGVENRTTSGAFLKAGGKIYLNNLNGTLHNNSFFIGANAIVSYYHQTALQQNYDQDTRDYLDSYSPVSAKGVLFVPVVSAGMSHHFSKRLGFDWGVQMPIHMRRSDIPGTDMRNYQPGVGSGQSNPFIGYLQAILLFKYTL